MTFCIGIKVSEGLIGIADTRISMGSQTQFARKLSVIEDGLDQMVLMTSGLRSLRDKVVTYFEKALEDRKIGFDKLYQAANALAEQVRRVAAEDKATLADAGLSFDLNCLIGGQLAADREHKLYMLYPQANWVEVTHGTPYCILGENSYGKPLLDRVLRYDSSLEVALKAGFLAFDATETSTNGVGYPIDVVVYRPGEPIQTKRFEERDLGAVNREFARGMKRLVERLPSHWIDPLLNDRQEAAASNVTPITYHES